MTKANFIPQEPFQKVYTNLIDEDNEIVNLGIETDGNKTKISTSDDTIQSTLNSILKELKKINLQLSIITNDDIDNTEVQ